MMHMTESPEDCLRMKKQIARLQEDLQAAEAKIVELVDENRRLRDLPDSVLHEHRHELVGNAANLGDVDELQASLRFCQQEFAQLRAEMETTSVSTTAQAMGDELFDRLKLLDNECKYLRSQLQRSDVDAPKLSAEEHKMFGKEVLRAQRQTDTLKYEVNTLRTQLKRDSSVGTKTPAVDLSERFASWGNDTKVLHEELMYLHELLDDRQGHSADELAELRGQLESMHLKIEEQGSDEKRRRHEQKQLERRVVDLEDENHQLRSEKAQAAEEDVRRWKQRLAELEDTVKDLHDDNNDLHTQVSEYADELTTLRGKAKSLDNANQILSKVNSASGAEVEALKERLAEADAEIEQLRARLKESSGKAKEAKRLKESLAQARADLRDALEANRTLSESFAAGSGEAWGLWEKKRHDLTRSKVAAVLLRQRIRAVGLAYYNKLARFQRGSSRRTADEARARITALLVQKSERLRLADRMRQWKDHAAAKRRERDSLRWLRVLWQTKGHGAGALQDGHQRRVLKRYQDKLRRYAEAWAKKRARVRVCETLLSITSRGKTVSAYRKWLLFMEESVAKRSRWTSMVLAVHRMSRGSRRVMLQDRWNTWQRYRQARREESFYWRQRGISEKAARALLQLNAARFARGFHRRWLELVASRGRWRRKRAAAEVLLSLTGRGVLRRRFFQWLDRSRSFRVKRLGHSRIASVLARNSTYTLLRVYYLKLYNRRLRKLRSHDVKLVLAQSLVASTYRRRLTVSFTMLLAWAIRGRRRHRNMLWKCMAGPLRVVTGGQPVNLTDECTRHGGAMKRGSRVDVVGLGQPHPAHTGATIDPWLRAIDVRSVRREVDIEVSTHVSVVRIATPRTPPEDDPLNATTSQPSPYRPPPSPSTPVLPSSTRVAPRRPSRRPSSPSTIDL
ncbi:hypothetical protein DIPPA_00915 [Diplonema papillatum]|nr:hypothetical protein DIPPA_00915 [Diplonema papillatum]